MLMDCELCRDEMALFGDDNAFVRYDTNSLSKGTSWWLHEGTLLISSK
jgi:hypothetical protein